MADEISPRAPARRLAHLLFIACAPLLLAHCSDDDSPTEVQPDPLEQFRSPEACGTCHPNHYAEWSSSMHAYAMQDPVFFALMERERQATGGELGQFCVSCHSPIALVTGALEGMGELDPETLPEVIRAGVSCESCHLSRRIIRADEEGGHFEIIPGDSIFGPMDQVVDNPFHLSILPEDNRFDRSDNCSPCHDLEVRGQLLESTFTEWNESSYAVRKECQDCHMPEYIGQAAVDGPENRRLHRHYFTGVDVAMTPFPDRAGNVARVDSMLKDTAALGVGLPESYKPGETILIQATVTNANAGHSLPSGTSFEREMWLEVLVTDQMGGAVFSSGDRDANGYLRDAHSTINPGGDTQLALWTAELTLGGEPREDITIFRADGTIANLIPAEGSSTADYSVEVPPEVEGYLNVSVRLLFRPFKPYVLRDLGLDYLQGENMVFEMERFDGVVPTGG